MAISNDKKAMLKTWAAAGDIMALEALALESMGRAGFVSMGHPALKVVTAVHAAVFGDATPTPPATAITVTTGLTNPAVPRCVSVVAGATYDGGNVTINGTDQFGAVISETLTPIAGNAVYGAKAFKTVTSFSYAGGGSGTHATNTLSIGTGDVLGLLFDPLDSFAIGTCDGVPEKATIDTTNNTVLFNTAPDGTKVFTLLCNL